MPTAALRRIRQQPPRARGAPLRMQMVAPEVSAGLASPSPAIFRGASQQASLAKHWQAAPLLASPPWCGPGCPLAPGHFPHFQEALGVQEAVELDGHGDEAGPAGLVARAQPGAVVAVEVLVEEQVLAPLRVGLEPLRPAEDRPPALVVSQEDPDV